MSQDQVTLVKSSLSLSQVVSRYTQLVSKGRRLAACCPFHNEKTPSFYVDDQKGLYHCFGCGKGGDMFAFVMDIENLPFPEALHFLADIAGVELPQIEFQGVPREESQALFALNERAAAFFQHELALYQGAKEYLNGRGIQPTTTELCGIGWAPNRWEGLYDAVSSDFPESILKQSGLFKEGQKGLYDMFRERVMFPIRDTQGRVIAFGGRRLDGEQPKYINSPETPIYTKGKHVYNLNLAKAYLKRTPELIVVEGYMDVVQLYQAGIGNVVASLGTAFTPEQAKLLKRHTSSVILNFDGDAAGVKAALTSIGTLLEVGCAVQVLTLADGQDPDDYVKRNGADAYRTLIEQAPDFLSFLIQHFRDEENLSDPNHQSFVVHQVLPVLRHVNDPIVRDGYVQKLADAVNLSKSLVESVVSRVAGEKKQTQAKPVAQKLAWRTKVEQEFLFCAMHDPTWAERLPESERPHILASVQYLFAHMPELLESLEHGFEDPQSQLDFLPETYRGSIRTLFFSDEFSFQESRIYDMRYDLILLFLARKNQENQRFIREQGSAHPLTRLKTKEILENNKKIKQIEALFDDR